MRKVSGVEVKRYALTTDRLPDRPSVWRAEALLNALTEDGLRPASRGALYDVIKSLWHQGYLERTRDIYCTRYGEGAVNAHWYRFARADRESERPQYRPGETWWRKLWPDGRAALERNIPLTQAQAEDMLPVPGATHPRTLRARIVQGVPDPDTVAWDTWQEGQTIRPDSRVTVWLPGSLRRQVDAQAKRLNLSRSAFLKDAVRRYLLQRPWIEENHEREQDTEDYLC